MIKAIIFGSNGQDGYYLHQLLVKSGMKVIRVSRRNADQIGDISDFNFVSKLIIDIEPDYIFNFAAVSSVRHELLFEHINTIEIGTLNILEACKVHCNKSKIFISGSALQFKNEGLPINENTEFDASSPYAVSRNQTVFAARYYRKTFGLKVYVGYFFHHDSPLRTENHLSQLIINKVKGFALGDNSKLKIGNINVEKEFNFAGDFVQAVWTLVNQDVVFEVIIGSGISHSIKDWLNICFKIVGLHWQDYVDTDEQFKYEFNKLVSDPSLLMSLGWKQETSIERLAQIMYNG